MCYSRIPSNKEILENITVVHNWKKLFCNVCFFQWGGGDVAPYQTSGGEMLGELSGGGGCFRLVVELTIFYQWCCGKKTPRGTLKIRDR